ncbi:MAG: hypothetical protein WCH79_16215 [Planctomycetia bacterium]
MNAALVPIEGSYQKPITAVILKETPEKYYVETGEGRRTWYWKDTGLAADIYEKTRFPQRRLVVTAEPLLTPADEAAETVRGVLSRWAPDSAEPNEVRTLRALLLLGAYEKDVARALMGEPPIRTDYPLPLPR